MSVVRCKRQYRNRHSPCVAQGRDVTSPVGNRRCLRQLNNATSAPRPRTSHTIRETPAVIELRQPIFVVRLERNALNFDSKRCH